MDNNSGYFPNTPASTDAIQPGKSLVAFVEMLLNKDELLKAFPDDFKLYILAFVKNLSITNFSKQDISLVCDSFDDAKTAYLMSLPPGNYSWDMEYAFTLLRPLIRAEACRSLDGFERRMEVSQIQQNYTQQEISGYQVQQNSGLFGKVRSFLGR